MDDLISRQAAIDAIRASTSKYTGFMEMEMYTDDDAVEAVNGVPSIDAVPVIRCKECKWWRKETDHTCRKWGGASPRNANGYCDDAERKEDGQGR